MTSQDTTVVNIYVTSGEPLKQWDTELLGLALEYKSHGDLIKV